MKKKIFSAFLEKEIIEFYIAPNTLNDTCKKFNISKPAFNQLLEKFGIPKHPKELTFKLNGDKQTKTCLTKSSVSELDIIKYFLTPNTLHNTALKFNLSESTIKKILLNNNIKLHDKVTIQLLQKVKSEQTCLAKYGFKSYSNTDEYLNKTRATNQKKFGKDNCMKDPNISKKQLRHRKNTCLTEYGKENYVETEEFKNSAVLTRLYKYNVEYSGQIDSVRKFNSEHSKEIQQKILRTKLIHNSFNTSTIEEKFYSYLKQYFNTDDILRQYNKDDRYPFNCDFYIQSIDLFIELNLHWTHGGHLYDSQNKQDENKLNLWKEKAKNSQFYNNAIKTWTIRDITKFNIAKQNTINYLIFYTEKDCLTYDFDKFYKS